ncbi:MAG TPA: hypothetical protein VF923_07825 [Gemmatimonadales bacterium]
MFRLTMFALVVTAPARAQSPRVANPERPTVATHAYPVAPGYLELEQGVRAQGSTSGRDFTSWEFNLKLGLAPSVQIAAFGTGFVRGPAGSGPGDMGVALKLCRALGRQAAGAVVTAVTLPTGDHARGLGAGRPLGSVIGVASVELPGGVHLDANAGPTAIGAGAPQGLATASFSRSLQQWTVSAELFEITAGGAGPRQAGALGALSWRAMAEVVIDAGGIAGLGAGSPNHLFAGVTTNFGRVF